MKVVWTMVAIVVVLYFSAIVAYADPAGTVGVATTEAGILESLLNDIDVFSAELKGVTLYSVKENQVQAGVAIELASYKDKLELDLVVGLPKQTLGLSVGYEANVAEALLNSVFKVGLPDNFRSNLTQSIGVWAGYSGVGGKNCDFDWGIDATVARYSF